MRESETSEELEDNELYNLANLVQGNSKFRDVVVFPQKERYVFSMIVIIKISDQENNLGHVSWISVEKMFQTKFLQTGLHVLIFSGKIIS